MDEFVDSVRMLNNVNKKCMDIISSEVLEAGEEEMFDMLHSLIVHFLSRESIPQDWFDTTLASFYKFGHVTNVEMFVLFCFLTHFGNLHARVLLNRLVKTSFSNNNVVILPIFSPMA